MLGSQSITEFVRSPTLCFFEQTFNARPLTPVSSDLNNLEASTANHSLFGNKNICLPDSPRAQEIGDQHKLFVKTQAYSNLICDRLKEQNIGKFYTIETKVMRVRQKTSSSLCLVG